MKSTKTTVFDRKSGEGEGPAVRPGSSTKVSVPLVLPQNRHPESCDFIDFHVIVIPTEAKWRDLLLFCPSNLTAPNKRPATCHPERTRISYFTALPAATYAALRKESRMKSTKTTVFDRKSGEGEGSAVRPGSRTKVSVPLVLPQNRHPARPGLPWERSASPIYRVIQHLWRGVEGPRRCSSYSCCLELRPPRPDIREAGTLLIFT
jgi:hypothetical protein